MSWPSGAWCSEACNPAPSSMVMRLVFFGTYDERHHPRVQVLREGLEARGHEIVECDAPLDLDTAARVRMVRQPWRGAALGGRLASRWRQLWARARSLPRPDAVVVPYLGHFDVHLARRLWRDVPLALDYFISGRDTAMDRGITSPAILSLLGRIDRAALRAADIPFVDVEGHLELLPHEHLARAVVVPIGAPGLWFSRPGRRPTGPLRVVFYGSYTPLQGAPVIGQALRLLGPEREKIRFTMIGRGQDLPATRRAAGEDPGVTWVDWAEPEDLPAIVAEHDVCLGIFGTGAKALRVVPNKAYQGAAAGCAVVTSDTSPQRRALMESALFVPPGDPAALAQALRDLAADPARVWTLRLAAHERADKAFRPVAVVSSLHDRLEQAVR
jgi:glycosyltransferase involved in cell wall biosynthesis